MLHWVILKSFDPITDGVKERPGHLPIYLPRSQFETLGRSVHQHVTLVRRFLRIPPFAHVRSLRINSPPVIIRPPFLSRRWAFQERLVVVEQSLRGHFKYTLGETTMVSQEPQDGRCNASVVDKVGLEVHDEVLDEVFHTGDDGRLVEVVLDRGAVTANKEPEYEDVIGYLREGFTLTAVKLRPSDADESEQPVHVGIDDDDPFVTNHGTEHVGFCERYPVKSEDRDVCPVHGGLSTGAPEGNTNALTHGLKAKRSNYYENEMTDEEKMLVEDFVDSWLDLSSYTWDDTAVVNELYRIAVDQIRLWNAQDEMKDGIVYDQYEDIDPMDGDRIYTTQENPANLPYDRLDRTTFKKLKDLGVLDDPESQQAEATESLAAKFADLDD